MNTARKDIISIDSGIFQDCRLRLDEMMTKTLAQMTNRGITSGTVSLKIEIALYSRPDENGEVHWAPQFQWKTGSNLKMEEKDGGLCSSMDEGVLVWDEYRHCWRIEETQRTLFEDE